MVRRFGWQRSKAMAVTGILLAAGGCASVSPFHTTPTPHPHHKIGTPYKIEGRTFVPAADPTYDEVGIASWYGPKFHGRLTANGELFDMHRLTAAHKTLPLPSLLQVTNLENGKTIVVRLNDRGPFVGDRIIDLSAEAAERIGAKDDGLARVRVEYLGPASLSDAVVAMGRPERPGALTPPTRQEPQHIAEPFSQGYYVRIGAFSSPETAVGAARQLPAVIPSRIDKDHGVGVHLVHLGPYQHAFAAEAALQEAQRRGFDDAHIVHLADTA